MGRHNQSGLLCHGVGLEDDHGENIEIAEDKLGMEIAPSIFHFEFTGFADLAYEVVEDEYLTPDIDPDSDDTLLLGSRDHLDARMPTGDWLRGNGVIRCSMPKRP